MYFNAFGAIYLYISIYFVTLMWYNNYKKIVMYSVMQMWITFSRDRYVLYIISVTNTIFFVNPLLSYVVLSFIYFFCYSGSFSFNHMHFPLPCIFLTYH